MHKNKGLMWNALGSTMYGVNSFIMLALVSRVGTVEEAGHFGIAFTTAQLLYIVGLFGVPHYHMTDYGEKYSFECYAKVRIATCLLMLVACFCSVFFLGFTGQKCLYTILLTVLMLLNVIGELYQSLFFQKNRLDLSGSALFFRTLWPLIIFCATVLIFKNIVLALAVQIVVNLLITLYYAVTVAPSFLTKKPHSSPGNSFWQLFTECIPLAFSLFLMNLIINMSKYGIEFVMDDVAQGYFNMIFMPAQVINLCSQFLFKPYLNDYALLLSQKEENKFMQMLRKQIFQVAVFTLICCVAAYTMGAPVLGFIYNKNLSGFAVALTLVVFGGGIYACCQLFYYILIIIRKQKNILLIYTLASALSIPLTYLLVSAYGIIGAALSFITTHSIILFCYFYVTKHSLFQRHS